MEKGVGRVIRLNLIALFLYPVSNTARADGNRAATEGRARRTTYGFGRDGMELLSSGGRGK